MEQYSDYKDSDAEWIGEIPAHWLVKKIKHGTYVKGRIGWKGLKSDEFLTHGYSYLVTGTDFNHGQIDWSTCYHIEKDRYEEDPYIQLAEGDLLITKDGTIGKVALVKDLQGFACLNSGIFLVRPTNGMYSTAFLYWVLSSDVFTKFINYTKTGSTISHLYQNVFVEFSFPIPKDFEQEAIASFLDRKTKQIDDLIAKKERLIELKKEERAAIINQAVTKGLDPDVTMKDSGIEWLGEIPEHWKTMPLKRIIKDLKSGVSVNSEDAPVNDNEIGILKTSCVYNYYFEPDENKKVLPEELNRVACPVKQGRIIISRMNTPNLVGASGYIEKEYANLFLPDRLWITEFYPELDLDTKWLSYVFISDSFRSEVSSRATGTSPSMKNISKEDLFTVKVPFPDHVIQKEIRSYIDKYLSQSHKTIDRYKSQIDLLKEYKSTLISEAVTGKIKVIT